MLARSLFFDDPTWKLHLRLKNRWALRALLCLPAFRERKPSKEELTIVLESFNAVFKARANIFFSSLRPSLARWGHLRWIEHTSTFLVTTNPKRNYPELLGWKTLEF